MEKVSTVFEQIYRLTYDKVAFYVLSKCGKVPEAEEILQETYAELYKVLADKGASYITMPEGFVMQLAKSKVFRYYSEMEQQRTYVFVETTGTPGEQDAQASMQEAVSENWEDALIDKLTAEEVMAYLEEKDELTREIFYQHYFQDKTLQEIAKSCGLKESAVKMRLYRTLQELRSMKRFAMVVLILLLAALLAKPVYTLAEDVISQIKRYFTEDTYDSLELIELGRAYKLYMSGKISKESNINVNGEDYTFVEVEAIWENNPWLEELDWDNQEIKKDEGEDFYFETSSD